MFLTKRFQAAHNCSTQRLRSFSQEQKDQPECSSYFMNVPYYRNEAISLKIQSFLQSIEVTPIVSDLSKVEYASALSRWVRMDEHCLKEAEKSSKNLNSI